MTDLRTLILAADDTQKESVEIPEWGVTVEVRGMTGVERAAFMTSCFDAETQTVKFDRLYPEVVIACTFNPEDGSKVFEATDRDVLNTKAASATERIAKAAMRLSGIDEKASERAKNA